MKNSDMSAMPITDTNGMPFNEVPPETCSIGLTKREHFAGLAMQGILSGVLSTGTEVNWTQVSIDATKAADVLLSELDREPSS